MDYEIAWTENALADLEAVVAHIAAADSSRALQVGEDIVRHTEMLRAFPRIGPVYERARNAQVHHVICGSYRIFYRIREKECAVDILHVWHGARNEPPL